MRNTILTRFAGRLATAAASASPTLAAACLLSAATALAQQGGGTFSQRELNQAQGELSRVLAVEQQEGDLARAVTLYREVVAGGGGYSEAARVVAKQRLANVLVRLGRSDEARALGVGVGDQGDGKAQGGERTAKLRQQARELLAETGTELALFEKTNSRFPGFSDSLCGKLEWLGVAAVPEVIATLDGMLESSNGHLDLRAIGLLTFLWEYRCPQADAYLIAAAQNERLVLRSITASRNTAFRLNDPVQVAYLNSSDPKVLEALVMDSVVNNIRNGGQLFNRAGAAQLLQMAKSSPVWFQARVLDWLARQSLSEPARAAALDLAQKALKSVDPDFGQAGEQFLLSRPSQSSVRGLQLLLDNLGRFDRRSYKAGYAGPMSLGAAVARPLLPAIDAAVPRYAEQSPESPGHGCLRQLMMAAVAGGDQEIRMHAFGWWDAGFNLTHAYQELLHAKGADADLVVESLKRVARLDLPARRGFLNRVNFDNLSPGAFEPMQKLLEIAPNDNLKMRAESMLLSTGHERVADLLLAAWRDGASAPRTLDSLLVLFCENPSDRVRAAMLEVLPAVGALPIRTLAILSLMQVGEPEVLSLVGGSAVNKGEVMVRIQERATPGGGGVRMNRYSPLSYLIRSDAEPKHGYTHEQVLATARDWAGRFSVGSVVLADAARDHVADDVVIAMADAQLDASKTEGSWPVCAMQRLEERLSKGGDAEPFASWFAGAIQRPELASAAMTCMEHGVVDTFQGELKRLVDGADGAWAIAAVSGLGEYQPDAINIAALLKSKHIEVREWASYAVLDGDFEVDPELMVPLLSDASYPCRYNAVDYLTARLHVGAVPGMLRMLRDEQKQLREKAAEGLAKIRFYSDQQAHWDRVTKGIDASPASAAAKLLLQAKPDQAKKQRLLAITSLGVLAQAEALPFLIEWSQEVDAEIVAAATEAIIAIHQNAKAGK